MQCTASAPRRPPFRFTSLPKCAACCTDFRQLRNTQLIFPLAVLRARSRTSRTDQRNPQKLNLKEAKRPSTTSLKKAPTHRHAVVSDPGIVPDAGLHAVDLGRRRPQMSNVAVRQPHLRSPGGEKCPFGWLRLVPVPQMGKYTLIVCYRNARLA